MLIRKSIPLLLLAGSTSFGATYAQVAPPPSSAAGGARPPATAALTADQVAKVGTVLAAYKPDALSVDDAKAIKRALREVGLRPSPALAQALRAHGFSAERLDQLDPRPPGPPADPGARPPPTAPATNGQPPSGHPN